MTKQILKDYRLKLDYILTIPKQHKDIIHEEIVDKILDIVDSYDGICGGDSSLNDVILKSKKKK